MVSTWGFLCVGLTLSTILYLIEKRFWRHWLGWLTAAGLAVFSGSVAMLVDTPGTLGSEEIFNVFPMRDLILFSMIVLGMIFQTFASAVHDRKARTIEARRRNPNSKRPPMDLDWWEGALPLFVAVPTFFALLSQVEGLPVSAMTLTMAFQNGFMWRAILQQSV